MTHILAFGETQSGKTHVCNLLHRMGPPNLLSVFFNTNHVGYVWGTPVRSMAQFLVALHRGDRRINYVPPSDLPGATAHLEALWEALFSVAKEGPVWCRLLVDEAQRFEPPGDREGPVEDIARRGLGKGIQLVVITQYPPGLKPDTRTNCPTRIVFKPGLEGEKFLQTYGSAYHPAVVPHTAHKRAWATYIPSRGWRLHPPA